MPFASFLKSSRLSRNFGKQDRPSNFVNGNAIMEKERPKRSFLRKLLRKADSDGTAIAKDGHRIAQLKIPPSPERTLTSPSPTSEPARTSIADPNKPLPPPPPIDPQAESSLPRPSMKLDRIISPFSMQDLQALFSGAPQFFARAEGKVQTKPSVAFPYDEKSSTDYLCDHVDIMDDAWVCASAETNNTPSSDQERSLAKVFVPRCWERPSVLSMQGLEKGTMGFQAALEIAVADALQNPDDVYSAPDVADYRWKALKSKEGVRFLTDAALIERLLNIAEKYDVTTGKYSTPSIQLYTELFTHVLHPPSRVIDVDDPYSLLVQIDALISVLNMEHIWFDFSKVEWRIRLGQLLWTSDDHAGDDVEVNGEPTQEATTQKYWLLLQILLSAELLFRLDTVTASLQPGLDEFRTEELQQYEKNADSSVRWSLLLARQWLENIHIRKLTKEAPTTEKSNTGWLASLTGSGSTEPVQPQQSINNLRFEGRHQARQAKGLVHFARRLHWPNTEAILNKVAANGISISDLEITSSTPLATPRSVSTQRSSYFSKRPGMRRGLSSINDRLSAIINPSGWLSNSYISGLILPGESLSHFLISTLLENDAEAVATLGEEANLYGGFVYRNKSFWSISCIVGRVLAGARNSRECMGWISSDVLPKGVKEQWVDIDVELSEDLYSDKKEKRPRIQRRTTVEQRGHIIAGADESSVLPGDFISPCDLSLDEGLTVKLQSLDFFASDETLPPTPLETENNAADEAEHMMQIKLYSAMVRFSVGRSGEPLKEVNLALQNDVYFLTAHPCAPPRIHKSIASDEPINKSKSLGHPLHKAFTYTKIALSHILTTPIAATFSSLLSPAASPTAAHFSSKHTTSSGIPKVLVIDCTGSTHENDISATNPSAFGNDAEVLGRAICSERGWNALVSRRGRSCLSCAIREAGAIGWRVILRVD